MKNKLNFRVQLGIVGFFTLLTGILIAWDYASDGQVDVHYLLHSKSLPGFSNWWALCIIPLLTWTSLRRISQRQDENAMSVLIRFMAALLFAAATSLVFSFGYDPGYLMLLPFIISLFYPLYKSEFLLGFVMGSLFFVGAAIPTMFGVILVGIYFCLYRLARIIRGLFRAKKPVI